MKRRVFLIGSSFTLFTLYFLNGDRIENPEKELTKSVRIKNKWLMDVLNRKTLQLETTENLYPKVFHQDEVVVIERLILLEGDVVDY